MTLNHSLSRRLAWILAGLTLALNIGTLVLGLLNQYAPLYLAFMVTAVSAAVVGGVIGWRQPANRVGWIIAGFALCFTLGEFSRQYTMFAVFTRPGSLPFFSLIASPVYWAWYPGLMLMFVFLPLFFPTGHLVSPRWRPVSWTAVLATFLLIALALVTPGDGEITGFPNPTGIEGTFVPDSSSATISFIAASFWLGLGIMAAMSLYVRYRRTSGMERQQIKWFTYAVVFLVAYTTLHQLFLQKHLSEGLSSLLLTMVLQGVWLAIGVAVLRYRLYDIDLIIRRTLLYSIVTALLASLYFGSVVVLQSLFTAVTGEKSSIAVVLSTLVIAALFNPLRHSLQRIVDRRFYRQKYDAQQVLARFAHTVRDEVSLEALSGELTRVVQETLQPETVSVWLKTIPQQTTSPSRSSHA